MTTNTENANKTENIILFKTKKGLPCLWEEGGGATNTGHAQIICDSYWDKIKPIYIRRKGHLSNGCHALFVVKEGYHIIVAKHHHRDFEIKALKVKSIKTPDEEFFMTVKTNIPFELIGYVAECEILHTFSNGEWDSKPSSMYQMYGFRHAIEAVMEKATCYHCRHCHYIDHDDDLPF